ncbi:MAG: hypothetical protein HY598_04300 [Candidatus Omnitrophica bacterium]|nr:hypothetical protein [Candidatus Omnitrophota bacterium]
MSCNVTRGLVVIGLLVAVGMLKAVQRNALVLQGYALGERVERAHQEATDVSWLEARVLNLTSPDHLSEAANSRQLKLVAWSTLSPQPPLPADPVAAQEGTTADPVQLADGRDTTD